MTTHDQHSEVNELDAGDQVATADRRPMDDAPQTQSRVPEESVTAASDTPTAAMKPVGQTQSEPESADEEPLFADDKLAGLRAQWASVQAGFVDNPRGCVEKADGLVSELIEDLTAGFASARSRLEDQWGRGETVSTEDLRVALKQYRAFFQRLLSV
jgi:hypothetical protein